jgi:DNA polymerase elongation subunit (family B)
MSEQTFYTFTREGDQQKNIAYDPQYVIAGDTDSVYIDLSAVFDEHADTKSVVKFADSLGEEANAAFPEFLKEVFNVPEERTSVVATDREVVSDKSLFMATKKYLMHVVDKEGVPKDEDKIMGMEIKKTDTAKIVRDLLKELVHMILENKTFAEVEERIQKFKGEYRTFSMLEIGRPSSVNELNKYYYLLKQNKTTKGFPYHVLAAMFYNEQCGPADRKIYEGNKIAIIYIQNPDSKYIAVPADADVLPKFVDDFLVDWNKMWETVEKKIQLYLAPVGFDYEGRQRALTEELVTF